MTPLWMAPSFAGQLLDRILVCLAEGTVLAAAVTLLLQLLPKKNSRTRFAVWFSTLIAIAALPVLRGVWRGHGLASSAGNTLITISSTWATYIILFWAAAAIVGLIRIAGGLWGLRRLRRSCRQIPSHLLGTELHSAITDFRRSRPLSILVSKQVQVPGAVGFLRPAIVLPAWLVEEPSAPELKYAVLHELAHLERWDDWSNLAQKLVKALLFFHPGVWWIERNLALEREIACDDTVIARSGNKRLYAQCLARLAEKNFMRRQLALAQAAVDRMRHLSQRVAGILDDGRPRGVRLWKPALAIVAVFSLLCAIPVSQMPDLVRISSEKPMIAGRTAGTASEAQVDAARLAGHEISFHDSAPIDGAAKLARDSQPKPPQVTPALFTMPSGNRKVKHPSNREVSQPRRARKLTPQLTAANAFDTPAPTTVDARNVVVVLVSDQVLTDREGDATGVEVVRVNIWQVRRVVPAQASPKPIPRKT